MFQLPKNMELWDQMLVRQYRQMFIRNLATFMIWYRRMALKISKHRANGNMPYSVQNPCGKSVPQRAEQFDFIISAIFINDCEKFRTEQTSFRKQNRFCTGIWRKNPHIPSRWQSCRGHFRTAFGKPPKLDPRIEVLLAMKYGWVL